jgi:hypothetical protein
MKILRPQKLLWPLLREHQSFCEVIVIHISVLSEYNKCVLPDMNPRNGIP